MKVAMQVEVSIAANTTNRNVVAQEPYFTAPFTGLLKLLDTGSAAGLRRGLQISGQAILDSGIVSSQNRMPLDPDDTVVTDVEVYQGQQIFLPVQNTTGGALTYRATLTLEQAA